jgi:type IV secretory pathway VirB10-like protein
MEWILDNLKLVIFVIVIVVYALKAMRGQSEAGGGDAQPTRRTMPGEEDAAEAERTRQIQEEIRRRILARQRGEEPQAAPPPLVMEESQPVPPPIPVQPVPATRVEMENPYEQQEQAAQAARAAAVLEQQRALEEQLRQVRLAREAAMAGVPRIAPVSTPAGSTRRGASVRRALRDDLAGRGSLRRAIVLREVLGEPVGLRTGPLPRR